MSVHPPCPARCATAMIIFAALALPFVARAATDGATMTTPASTPVVKPSTCGDGLLTGDETCERCPDDCQPSSCLTSGKRKLAVVLTPQSGYDTVGAVTILLAYRHGILSLPGEKNTPAAKARVQARDGNAQVFVNDLGYALRVVIASQQGLPVGLLLDADLDTCRGATPTLTDVSCRIEACAQGGGRLHECSCEVTLP